jgi:arabinose-5-phosphate isomerase
MKAEINMPVSEAMESGPDPFQDVLDIAREVLQIEAEGILHLMERLDQSFVAAVQWIFEAKGRVIVTGIGKSGIVGRKIVATLSSTGTPALFLHPVEAMHGDLGMVRNEDVVLALSNSGETDELNIILPSLRNIGTRIISFVGNVHSTLARYSDLVVYSGVPREACPLGLAPTASTTAMLAMGDALAVALIRKRNFQVQDFRRNHPGGHLGERLQVPIRDLMRRGDDIPKVGIDTSVLEAVEEMQHKGLGATLVVGPEGRLKGIFTDGDLRRAMRRFADLGGKKMGDVMSRGCRTIRVDHSVADGLEMMEHYLITVLPVVDADERLQGILHLHDLLGKGRIRFTR